MNSSFAFVNFKLRSVTAIAFESDIFNLMHSAAALTGTMQCNGTIFQHYDRQFNMFSGFIQFNYKLSI